MYLIFSSLPVMTQISFGSVRYVYSGDRSGGEAIVRYLVDGARFLEVRERLSSGTGGTTDRPIRYRTEVDRTAPPSLLVVCTIFTKPR